MRDLLRFLILIASGLVVAVACTTDDSSTENGSRRSSGAPETSESVHEPPAAKPTPAVSDPVESDVPSDLGPPVDPIPEPEPQSPDVPPVRYMGREIAQTMHWRGAEWLIRATREDEENASAMIDALGIERGQSVCDLGCGNGYHTLRLAERVGTTGRVLAVDVQPQMLSMLRRRAEKAGITNIERIVGTAADPRLPEASCDVILMVDVYHELSYPELMLTALRKALRPGGRIALVEFRAEDPDVPIKPLHKMSKEQIEKEFAANGFKVVGQFDDLPWQHLMFLGRDDDR